MEEKINNKTGVLAALEKGLFFILLMTAILVYTRFVNLGWGLPYPMNPDERNMAVAIGQLNCPLPTVSLDLPKSIFGEWRPVQTWIRVSGDFNLKECFNPHFFAYGQFSLYLGYLMTLVLRISPTLALRLISASASVATAFILFRTALTVGPKGISRLLTLSLLIFLPYAIQFAHFGTTESLLMFFYTLIIYKSILFIDDKLDVLRYVFSAAFIFGMAFGTKASAGIFVFVPLLTLILKKNHGFHPVYFFLTRIFDLFVFCLLSLFFSVLFSPHNIINFTDFIGALKYESDVALGSYVAFYTRQFVLTTPVFFQLEKVFPYALGEVAFWLSFFGLFFIGWKDKRVNLLRFAFFIYFLPTAFFFAKWTRFMAPIFPILTLFVILVIGGTVSFVEKNEFLKKLNKKTFFLVYPILYISIVILVFLTLMPGLAYISVYENDDVRFQASEWINKNIPPGSLILSETANVVDIPINNENNLDVVSFNFYDLDYSLVLQEELKDYIDKADYIFVPSRRIFANLNNDYPLLNEYYRDLFSGKLGFKKVAEFSAGLNDENAEETWTVFDHPVIRIYGRADR